MSSVTLYFICFTISLMGWTAIIHPRFKVHMVLFMATMATTAALIIRIGFVTGWLR